MAATMAGRLCDIQHGVCMSTSQTQYIHPWVIHSFSTQVSYTSLGPRTTCHVVILY